MHDETQALPRLSGWMRRWSRRLDRRSHLRVVDTPLVLWIEGRRYKTLDWSIGGARIPDCAMLFGPGDVVCGTIDPIGDAQRGEFVAEVVRRSKSGEIGLRFLEISAVTLFAMESVT